MTATTTQLPPPDASSLWDKLDALVSGLAAEDYEAGGHDVVLVRHGRLTRHADGYTAVPFESAVALQDLGFLEAAGGGAGEPLTVRVTEAGRYQLQKWQKRIFRAFRRGQPC